MKPRYKLTYNKLVRTVSEIVNNDEIVKDGLTLHYSIPEDNHQKLDEGLYYMSNPNGKDFEHTDIIEVVLGGIEIIIKKDE